MLVMDYYRFGRLVIHMEATGDLWSFWQSCRRTIADYDARHGGCGRGVLFDLATGERWEIR